MTSTATAVPDIRRDRRYQVRQLGAATVGNIVEWYDWYIYAILASYFAGQFFPSSSDNPLLPLLSAMAIFAVGFLARPLGGLVIGMLADRFGRRSTLAWTIVGMGLGSLIIGLTPTYETIGVLAPVILVIARLLQGISTGGEFAAAAAFMVESAPPGRRGFFSSFSYISATTANLLAVGISTLLVTTLSADDMTAWGWRVPFLIGSVGALIGLWVRTHAEETHQVDETRAPAARVRMFDFLREHPKQALQLFLMVASSAVLFYVWTGDRQAYANIAVGFDVSKGLLISIASMSIFLVLQPLFGVLSDRIGRRPLLFAMSGFFIIFTVPLLGSLSNSAWSFFFVQVTGLFFIAMWTSISPAVLSELFPARLRSSGIGFPYALSVAIFGGTAPYLATYLAGEGHAGAFAWYIVALSVVAFLVFIRLPETAHKPLD